MAQLPKDVTPEEKAEPPAGLRGRPAGAQERQDPPEQLQPLQFKMMEIGRKGSNLTRQDILELTRMLEAAAGKPAAKGP